ncbi:S8 family serine peptidase [candidate division WOR-3 bacterium]|nr:S8 family serine peptidase [candidate division WOR-3 bacterium]
MDHKSKQIKNLSSSLDRLYKLYAEKKEYRQFARQSDLQLVEDRVVVTVLTKPGITTANIDGNNLRAFGSRIQAKANHSMRVEIPISELENVATSIKDFAEIIPPMRPKEHAVTSEGVALMNADHWHSVGDSGSGVKVAVIDGGFTSLINAQTEGDIPSSYTSHDFTGTGLQTGTPHGTAVAEAIFDLVPNAEFYLYKIADVTDFENAKDTCISNGVDIVNHSMGWFNTGGYYDGTGFICNIVNNALSNGILWVNSAGNSAEDHYRSIFADDGSGYHAFGSGNVNPIGPDPTHVWLHDPGEAIIITLNWDDYIYSNQDYDLYLARYDTIPTPHWSIVASSTERQTGSSYPEETIVYTNPYANGMYGVAVKEYSTSDDWDFTLFDLSRSFGYHTNSSSLTDPGTITDVVTVGAINRINYTSGPQETFSSQGPTTDGRTKPDVAAPDNCNSYAYGYWSGTSLSSPHTAGVCALIKSRFPGYNNSEIRDYLYTNCTVDLGASGKDNVYGWGKVEMPDISLTVTSPNGGEDFHVDSVHNVTWTSGGTSGGVRIEYSTNNGSSWSDVIAGIPDTGVYPWTIPDTPSDSCLLRITDTIGSPSDTCDAIFKISPIPYITVTSPNGGEDFEVDSIHNVTWISYGVSGGVLIQYSTDSGSSWSDVIAGIPDTGVYPWTIPDTPSDSCLLRIADTNGSLADTSDAIFKISPIPYITVTAPNGGEDWGRGYSYYITWTSTGTSGRVKIEYSINNGSSWLDVIAEMPDTGVYFWTIPDTTSDSCLVIISDTSGSPADTSDAVFSFVSVTAIPTPELPEVYSFNIKGITVGNQLDIKYALPEKAKLKLEVYDIKGTKIKELSEEKPAGFYSGKIDMSGKPAGVYFVRMEENKKKFIKINKVVLVK